MLEALATTLREARLAKGLSQRALSERAGFPQAQISRVENGEVDPQLSTLIELARTLDLEVQLVPRGALPAIAAVVKEVGERSDERAARSILDALEGQARLLLPRLREVEAQDFAKAIREIVLLAPHLRGPAMGPLKEALFELEFLGRQWSQLSAKYREQAITTETHRLRDLRNTLVHAQGVDDPRPAYSLDDDDGLLS